VVMAPPIAPPERRDGVGRPVSAEGQAGGDAVGGPVPDFSGTNVQEAGVDEPDIVKTDGRRIFAVTDRTLRIVAPGGGVTASLALDGFGHQLLIRGDRVLVVASKGGSPDSPVIGRPVAPETAPVSSVTIVTEIDVSGPPTVTRTMEIDGRFVDARQNGAVARLVIDSAPDVIVPGPAGTVAAEVRRAHPEVWISVSATTRQPRPGEENGVHYWFVSDEEFDRMVAEGDLLEWAVVHKAARYGTPRQPVDLALASGHPAMLEIDLQGARQVRRTMPDALFVFLKPPSWEELVRRLVGRGTETEEERTRRLATAKEELAAEAEFDVAIVNHEVHDAAEQLVALMEQSPTDL